MPGWKRKQSSSDEDFTAGAPSLTCMFRIKMGFQEDTIYVS